MNHGTFVKCSSCWCLRNTPPSAQQPTRNHHVRLSGWIDSWSPNSFNRSPKFSKPPSRWASRAKSTRALPLSSLPFLSPCRQPSMITTRAKAPHTSNQLLSHKWPASRTQPKTPARGGVDFRPRRDSPNKRLSASATLQVDVGLILPCVARRTGFPSLSLSWSTRSLTPGGQLPRSPLTSSCLPLTRGTPSTTQDASLIITSPVPETSKPPHPTRRIRERPSSHFFF